MKPLLRITYRHTQSSEALSALIESHTAELSRHYGHDFACRVVVDPGNPSHPNHQSQIRLEVDLKGKTLVAHEQWDPKQPRQTPEDLVRHAFRTLRRELDTYAALRIQRRTE